MKAVAAAFNQEKALVGVFSVITNLRMELFEALLSMNAWKVVFLLHVDSAIEYQVEFPWSLVAQLLAQLQPGLHSLGLVHI